MLSASHNPGGPDEDFGIKFNSRNGGPSVESVTEEIFRKSKEIEAYKVLEGFGGVNTSEIGDHKLTVEGTERVVRVIDNAAFYVDYMKTLFDFEKIRALISRPDFSMCFDAMHGVSGPYAKRIFADIF